ncbi:MAG: hypothetical protein KME07_12905 [Pegethrix bostrychoides GSE-TBD4-15B]|jgi:hypothetical protein|uniref:Uncharacterized protein n=1 Tax=Pegethrix bostrychoides GSE-TBD4-15B TaxID=2839662 RepID=A0A951PBM0_9CYAN|nr:hypothetical protein [Pegethrix bostrychoides GSE-TBD4-15B]
MKSIKYLGFFLAATVSATVWLCALSGASQTAIQLQTDPPLNQVIPATAPTQLTLQAVDSNQTPLANANIQLRLLTPAKSPWFTSDFPIVEGTTLLELESAAPSGKLQFEQTLPIRGTYRAEVRVTPQLAGAFEPFEQVISFAIPENPVKYRNLAILAVILLLVGLGGGWVLGGNQSPQAGEIAPQPARMLLSGVTVLAIVVLLTINMSAELAESHAGNPMFPTAPATPTVQQAQNVQVQLAGATESTVGQLATQTVKITDAATDEPLPDVAVKLQVVGLEDNKPVFNFIGQSNQTGELTWQQQLFDGAPHQVTATVAPIAGSPRQFSPIRVAHRVEVEGIAPPLYIRFISLVYFTAFFTASLIAGIVLRRHWLQQSGSA